MGQFADVPHSAVMEMQGPDLRRLTAELDVSSTALLIFSISFLSLASSRFATVTALLPRLCHTPILTSALIAWPSIILSINVLCTNCYQQRR